MHHLRSETCLLHNICTKIGNLDKAYNDLEKLNKSWKSKKKVSLPKRSIFQSGGSYAGELAFQPQNLILVSYKAILISVYESLNGQTIIFNESPIIMMKAVKNEVEVDSMIK
jgi:hypothetical protein